MPRRRNRQREVDTIEGKFICGWAEFQRPVQRRQLDEKGRLERVVQQPPKIVTKLMVELPDGSCVPIHGEHYVPMETEIKGAFQTAFPSKLKEVHSIASKAYKKGATVKVKRIVFPDDGWTEYDEIE
jgi:hypothetical protein